MRAAKSTFAQRINVKEEIPVVFKVNGCTIEPEKVPYDEDVPVLRGPSTFSSGFSLIVASTGK